jgi:two-component system chemotaxis response regulator CheY
MKINVLIVEDDAAMRVILKSIVQNAGLEVDVDQVFEAEHGGEGLKVLETEKVDLMLVDIYMPVMDGLEMLDYARDNPDWSHIPAIVVSSDNDEDRVDAILRQGMGFVHKPLTHLLLKDRIHEMIQKNQIKEE